MTEKPLHVQVAEALGYDTDPEKHERDEAPQGYSQCTRCGANVGWDESMPDLCCPRYDTDWSATGPLIERLHLCLFYGLPGESEAGTEGLWAAGVHGHYGLRHGWYATPLIAVCHLILALGRRREATKIVLK